jgi:hypothetical protein
MTLFPSIQKMRTWRLGPAAWLAAMLGLVLAAGIAIVGPARLIAQIEGERGIIPMARSTDIEVTGIEVNTTGRNGQEAREAGWKEAYKRAWAEIDGPAMPDGQLAAMVSAVVIEQEQIGPRRYIATLTVSFDRAKAGQYVGAGEDGAIVASSAPLLVIPVLYSGGVAQVFEVRTPWQRAWAEFRTGTTPIDYVRPVGAGGESLLLTAGQTQRRSRLWWRNVLDEFAAADVIMPLARLDHQWPGGPVRGVFTARYGPDNTFIESFALTARDDAAVPAMLAQAVARLDKIYARALAAGLLKPDPTLNTQRTELAPAVAAMIEAARRGAADNAPALTPTATASPGDTPAPAAQSISLTVQVPTPDARSVDTTVAVIRSAPGVQSAATTSIAIGGTSVVQVSFAGDADGLATALRARGWQVSVSGSVLSIRR